MDVRVSPRIAYSLTEPPKGSYWDQCAALVSWLAPRCAKALMIGAAGMTIPRLCDGPGKRGDIEWTGYDPDPRMVALNTGYAVSDQLSWARGRGPYNIVVVDAYVMDKPVSSWQNVREVARNFMLASGCIVIVHGEITPTSDKWKIHRI